MDSLLNIFSFRISQRQCLMGLGLKVLISLWFPLLSDWFLCGNPPLCAWQGIASAEFSIALLAYWPFCPPCLHMYWTTHSLLDSRLPFAACFSGTIGTNSWISRQVKETCQKPVKSWDLQGIGPKWRETRKSFVCPPCLHMYWTTRSLLNSRLPFAACFSGAIGQSYVIKSAP